MQMRTLWLPLLGLAAVALTAGVVWGLGFPLRETKEELKLRYDVAVHDHGDGRATVEFTLVDDGRLKPVYAIDLSIPAREKDKGGGYPMDLSVPLDLQTGKDGKRIARFEMRKDWAERAEIWLSTYSLDGKQLAMTRYHHVIPLAKYLKAAPAKPDAAATAAERKRD